MNSVPNFWKKIIYGTVIVVLFGTMYPYTDWLNEEKKATISVKPRLDKSTRAAS